MLRYPLFGVKTRKSWTKLNHSTAAATKAYPPRPLATPISDPHRSCPPTEIGAPRPGPFFFFFFAAFFHIKLSTRVKKTAFAKVASDACSHAAVRHVAYISQRHTTFEHVPKKNRRHCCTLFFSNKTLYTRKENSFRERGVRGEPCVPACSCLSCTRLREIISVAPFFFSQLTTISNPQPFLRYCETRTAALLSPRLPARHDRPTDLPCLLLETSVRNVTANFH